MTSLKFCFLQNLMSLLTGPSADMDKPRIHAVRALADYVVCLRCRIKCYQDPNLYTAKQGNFCSGILYSVLYYRIIRHFLHHHLIIKNAFNSNSRKCSNSGTFFSKVSAVTLGVCLNINNFFLFTFTFFLLSNGGKISLISRWNKNVWWGTTCSKCQHQRYDNSPIISLTLERIKF